MFDIKWRCSVPPCQLVQTVNSCNFRSQSVGVYRLPSKKIYTGTAWNDSHNLCHLRSPYNSCTYTIYQEHLFLWGETEKVEIAVFPYSPSLPWHAKKHLLKWIFSKTDLWLDKSERRSKFKTKKCRLPLNILKEKFYIKSLTLEA